MNLAAALVDAHVSAGRGGRTAILCEGRSLSYRDLQGLVNRTGNALRSLGVQPEQRVAILLPDIPEFIAAFLGAAKVGAVAVPCNTLLKADELTYILNHSRAPALVADEALMGEVRKARPGLRSLRHVLVVGQAAADELDFAETAGKASDALDAEAVDPADPVLWAYSSGSTGSPKAAVHSHETIHMASRLFPEAVLAIRSEDRSFAVPKLFFTFGLGVSMYIPLRAGSAVILNPRPPDPEGILQTIHRERPTLFYAVPTLYVRMLQVPGAERRFDLSSIRIAIVGGEPMAPEMFRRWREAFGLEILEGIGSSEALMFYCVNRPGQSRPGSCGRPVPGYDLRILDADGNEVASGEAGVLALKGPTLFQYYAGGPDLTRRSFRGEWFLTGDQFRQDADGYYWFQGRADDMLRVAGTWVSPAEVEGILMAHPAVLECAVVGVPDGQGTTRPKAYVVPRPGTTAGEALADELVGLVRGRIAAYKVPRWVEFVPDLPKTPTGKIQRFKLRAGPPASVPSPPGGGRGSE